MPAIAITSRHKKWQMLRLVLTRLFTGQLVRSMVDIQLSYCMI